MKKIYFTLLFILGTFLFTKAQIVDYQSFAPGIRTAVWSWKNPEFKNYEVPAELENESAVILARHRKIEATAKGSTFAKQFFMGSNTGKLFYNDINRHMIKINDQAALNRYSEFAFKEEEQQKIFRTTNSTKTIFGARIIKPDGTIKEVDVSKLAVSITEGVNDKEAYKKLAIPELQLNDILDMFTCDIYELESYNLSEQLIPFYSLEYPTLYYSCSLKFGKNLTIEYRSVNNAPEFTRSQDENGNTILTAEQTNLMRVNGFTHTRWMSPFRDLPMIRFSVLQNASQAFFKPESARPIGVFENIPYSTIIEDAKGFLTFQNPKLSAIYDTHRKVTEIVNDYKMVHSDISKEKLADIIYAALNFEWAGRESYHYNSATFILMLRNLFTEYDIECKVAFATNKYSARKDEVLSHNDLTYAIIANDNLQSFFIPYRYRVPGEFSPGLQGEPAATYTFSELSTGALGGLKVKGGWGETIIFPETAAIENMNRTQMNVTFNPDNIDKVDIERNSAWSGSAKGDIQSLLLLFEDWDKEMRNYLLINKTYLDELGEKRRTKKLIKEVEGIFEKNRVEHIDDQKNEIILYHDMEPDEITNFRFTSLGVTPENPELKYDIAYTLSGFVRKAGDNIILDAGRFIGKHWNPDDNERARIIDAYLPTKRIAEYEISIRIPENYSVGNVENLNMNYSNEFAAFEANAMIDNDTIIIKVKKSYLKSFVPKDKWINLIDIIDKANEFYSKSIVFEKNNIQINI